ncbi:hypothetical protein EDC32_101734 [Laceyella sacchari]|nr:hypothetical protein EDC32_101734 [Laceyella sacchari]
MHWLMNGWPKRRQKAGKTNFDKALTIACWAVLHLLNLNCSKVGRHLTHRGAFFRGRDALHLKEHPSFLFFTYY